MEYGGRMEDIFDEVEGALRPEEEGYGEQDGGEVSDMVSLAPFTVVGQVVDDVSNHTIIENTWTRLNFSRLQ